MSIRRFHARDVWAKLWLLSIGLLVVFTVYRLLVPPPKDPRRIWDFSTMPPCCRPPWWDGGVTRVWTTYEAFNNRAAGGGNIGAHRFWFRFWHFIEYEVVGVFDYYRCEWCGHAIFVGWAESHPIVDCPAFQG